MTPVALKRGYKTTEFWIAAAGFVIGLLALFGVVDPDKATPAAETVIRAAGGGLAGLVSLGYSISRGQTKKGALENLPITNAEV